ncbi:MAG: hypothetical protein WAV16_03940 [Candidatus Moraniibacteriota bacterium]
MAISSKEKQELHNQAQNSVVKGEIKIFNGPPLRIFESAKDYEERLGAHNGGSKNGYKILNNK